MNPPSIGHITALVSPQNGHVTVWCVSFALLRTPEETLNIFPHFLQEASFPCTRIFLTLLTSESLKPEGLTYSSMCLFYISNFVKLIKY